MPRKIKRGIFIVLKEAIRRSAGEAKKLSTSLFVFLIFKVNLIFKSMPIHNF